MSISRAAPEGSISSARTAAILVALLALSAALRLYSLDDDSVWADEMIRIMWSKGQDFEAMGGFKAPDASIRRPPGGLRQALQVVNRHDPPLNGLLMNVWMRTAGSDSDFTLRLYSCFVSVLAVLAAFLAGTAAAGRRAGLWTGALVAVSPFHVYYGQEVNHYALGSCLIAFSFFFYWRMIDAPSPARAVGLLLTGTAALYAHYYCGVVLMFQGLAAAYHFRREVRRLVPLALTYLAIGVAFFAPHAFALKRQIPELTAAGTVGPPQGLGYLVDRLQDMALVPWFGHWPGRFASGLTVAIAALIPLGVIALLYRLPRERRAVVAVNVLGPMVFVVVLFLSLRTNSILWPRYQLFFSFALFVAIGQVLALLRPAAAGALAGALTVACGFGLAAYYRDFTRGDWAQAARAMAEARSDDPVLVTPANMTYSMARYVRGENLLFGVDGGNAATPALAAELEGRAGAWLMVSWARHIPISPRLRPWLECRFARRERVPLRPGIEELEFDHYFEPRPGARCEGQAPGGSAGRGD